MSEECYLDLLPPELKGHLIKFCNGATIISLGKLSAEWAEFILSTSKEEWFRVVKGEIPLDYILDILLSLYPKLWVGDEVFWSDIYVSWNKWRTLQQNSKLHKLLVFYTRCEITSLQFSGSWIFVGTREGQLAAVNINNGETLIPLHECGTVLSIDARRTNSDEITHAFSGSAHDELILRGKSSYTFYNLRNAEVNTYGKTVKFWEYKCFGSQEVRTINIHYRSIVTSSSISTETEKTLYNVYCSVLQVWNEKILLSFDDGSVQVYDYNLNPLDHEANKINIDPKYLIEKRVIVSHLHVIFILDTGTSSSILGKAFDVIVGKQMKSYHPLPVLGGEVTAVLYHAGYLFIGSSDGFLHMFKMESDNDLLCLNFSKPHCQVNVTEDSTDPIVDFSIQENDDCHFFLAAASINKVYLLSTSDLDNI